MTPAALQRLQPPSESVKIDLRLVDRSSSSSGLLDQVASRTGGFGGGGWEGGDGGGTRSSPPRGGGTTYRLQAKGMYCDVACRLS